MSDPVMIDRVRRWLSWPVEAADRLEALDRRPVSGEFDLPPAGRMHDILERFEVRPVVADEVVRAAPSPDTHLEAWWLLERLYEQVVAEPPGIPPPWPAPVATDDPLTHHFHLYVFVAAVPHVLNLDAEREIPADVTWSTLTDVGLQLAHYETREGRPGFDGAFWIWQHFRGQIHRLGRLQFEPWRIDFDPANGDRFRRGDPALGVHIPALGPLTPEACDESLARAKEFYPRHFPEESYEIATCTSWLLDEQLASYLPETSNIVRFQRRFEPVADWSSPGDDDILRYVFGRVPNTLEELNPKTSLQRAVVAHLEAGKHWLVREGWIEL